VLCVLVLTVVRAAPVSHYISQINRARRCKKLPTAFRFALAIASRIDYKLQAALLLFLCANVLLRSRGKMTVDLGVQFHPRRSSESL